MSADQEVTREQVADEVAEEVARLGPAGLDKAAVVNKFLGRGVSRATLYRWVDAAVAGRHPGESLARKVKQAAKARDAAVRPAPPAEESAAAVAERLPTVLTPDDVSGAPAIKVIEILGEIIADLKALVGHAKTDDGKVRNARLLLSANGELRKTLETCMRLYEAMRDVQQIDRMHAAIVQRIADLSPETADLIMKDIGVIADNWMTS